jgi:hypothetical protein
VQGLSVLPGEHQLPGPVFGGPGQAFGGLLDTVAPKRPDGGSLVRAFSASSREV